MPLRPAQRGYGGIYQLCKLEAEWYIIFIMALFGRPTRRQRYSSNIFLLSKIAKLVFFGLIGFFVIAFILFVWFSRDLPTPGKLSASNFPQSTKIFDRNEILLYDIYRDENRTYITLDQIPKNLQQATIAIEDKDFYKNQ